MKQNYSYTVLHGKEFIFKKTVGLWWAGCIIYAIGYSFFILAILNLLLFRPLSLVGLLASVIWIAIIIGLHILFSHKVGIRQHLVNIVEGITRNRFAYFTSGDSGESILCFGYMFLSRRYYVLKLRPKGIISIDWGPGQGNDPERDNSWYVTMWFDENSVVLDGSGDGLGIYCIGPSLPKAACEAFGSAFIEFLIANQVHLKPPSQDLLGQIAEVAEPLRHLVKIRIGTEEYPARLFAMEIDRGTTVVVEEIRGTSVYVTEQKRDG